jgi:hypothetical protein
MANFRGSTPKAVAAFSPVVAPAMITAGLRWYGPRGFCGGGNILGSQNQGGTGFPYPAFLIGNTDDMSHSVFLF